MDMRTDPPAMAGKAAGRAKRGKAPLRRKATPAKPSTSNGITSAADRAQASGNGAVWIDDASKWATIAIAAMLAVFALRWGAFFLVPTTVALAFGFTLGPMVDWLERRGLPPYAAASFIVVALGAVLYGLFLAFAIPLEEWSIRVPDILDKARVHLFALRATLERLQQLGETVQEAARSGEEALAVDLKEGGIVTMALASAPAILTQILIAFGAFFFFLANRSRLRTWLLLLPVSQGVRFRIARMFRDTEFYLSRYVAAITVVNIGLGIATGCVMWLLGVPSPALWGAMAALLNYIPYLGPALLTMTLAGVALVTFDETSAVLLPPGAFLILNVIESQFVTPSVVGHRLTLNPFMVFMALAFWMWLWGPIGAFLAVPLLIMGTVVFVHATSDGQGEEVARFGSPARV